MAATVVVDRKDFERLLDLVRYVIDTTTDIVLKDYLVQELSEVVAHFENEQTGNGDQTCMVIDQVISFILGGQNGHERDTKDPEDSSG